MTDPEAFYKVYRKKINKSNVLIHFRIASKGVKTVDNCHPYMVSPELGFIHNGTIYTGLEDYGKEKSDTWAYNKQILKHLPPDFYMYPVLCNILESKIGNSKLAFMDDEEVITIIGDSKGEAHYTYARPFLHTPTMTLLILVHRLGCVYEKDGLLVTVKTLKTTSQ